MIGSSNGNLFQSFKGICKIFSIAVAIVSFISTQSFGMVTSQHTGKANKEASSPEVIPGEIIVKLKKESSALSVSALNSQMRALGVKVASVEPFVMDDQYQLVKVMDPAQSDVAMMQLETLSNVEYAEPNYVLKIMGQPETANMPNDPDFTKLWGLQNTGQADSSGQMGKAGSDIDVVRAWEAGITGSKNIVVAVIDTGVDHTHPDLVDNIYTNSREIEGNGIDDDGNGFIDDIRGWNFFANNNNALDDHSHGTHCAGTIGGAGNNGIGVVGVNWNVSILPVKFLGGNGSGSTQGAINSIKYATKMGVDIMSNSWGGGGFSQALQDAITESNQAGILFVAAAGNDSQNNDTTPTYPATYPVANIVSVAATDNQDNLATFSNYGRQKVHVSAPGVRVWSTVRVVAGKPLYAAYSGTSMATPHVAGAAALLLSAFPNMTAEEIKTRLITTSDQVLTLKKKTFSKGRINLYNAITNTVPPSLEPPETAWKDVQLNGPLPESAHPYAGNLNLVFNVSAPGAKMLRVIFERLEIEAKYDSLKIETLDGAVLEMIEGTATNHVTEPATTDSLNIRLTTDNSVHKWGFKVAKVQAIF